MYFGRTFVLTALAAATAATLGCAEQRPQGAKKAPPQQVANFYAGKTQTWKVCNGGGIYYGGGWQARAYCNKNRPSIGIGTWSVNAKGRICHDLTWYWIDDDGATMSEDKPVNDRNCDDIVLAPDGDLWARWVHKKQDAGAWWNMATSKNIQKGNKLKGKFNRLRRKLGV